MKEIKYWSSKFSPKQFSLNRVCGCMPSCFSCVRLCEPKDCSLPGSSFLLTSSFQMLKISHKSPRCLFHRNCQKLYAFISDGYNLPVSDGGCSERNSNSRLEEDQFLVFVWSLSLFKEKLKHLRVNEVGNSIRIKECECCQGIFRQWEI